MIACRVLVIEDRRDAADQLVRLLSRLGTELALAIDPRLLVCDHLNQFECELDKYYNHDGIPISSEYNFHITALDLIFQATPHMTEADGGERLLSWLDGRAILPHLGRLVVRSHKKSDILAGRAGTIYAQKHTIHEEDQWRQVLQEFIESWPTISGQAE